MEAQIAPAAPIHTPHMSGPVPTPFTDSQWRTLMALMDTVIPSIQAESTTQAESGFAGDGGSYEIEVGEYEKIVDELGRMIPGSGEDAERKGEGEGERGAEKRELLEKYLNEKASDNEAFQNMLKRTFGLLVPEKARKGLAFVLSSLEYIPPQFHLPITHNPIALPLTPSFTNNN